MENKREHEKPKFHPGLLLAYVLVLDEALPSGRLHLLISKWVNDGPAGVCGESGTTLMKRPAAVSPS